MHNVNFDLLPGQTLGVVGESGSGKTTTARMALGLLRPDAGTVELLGGPWSQVPESARRSRRSSLGAVYQDPLSSFDPRLSAEAILADALSFGATRNPAPSSSKSLSYSGWSAWRQTWHNAVPPRFRAGNGNASPSPVRWQRSRRC
ncbi:ATP-binding cassette domain-containing protein [Arthrobacter alpinus]|nr:ATP-binding cassette domain-containing protein [Arthrobacter alpinus]